MITLTMTSTQDACDRRWKKTQKVVDRRWLGSVRGDVFVEYTFLENLDKRAVGQGVRHAVAGPRHYDLRHVRGGRRYDSRTRDENNY